MFAQSKLKGPAFIALAFFAALLAEMAADAHRAKYVFTTLSHAASGRLEVVHQIHLHDASQALSLIENSRTAEVLTLEGQAKLLLHVENSFRLWGADGASIPLEIIGAEAEGPHLYLYFESDEIPAPQALTVQHAMLMDLFPDQRNQLNATVGATLKSQLFRDPEEKLALSF